MALTIRSTPALHQLAIVGLTYFILAKGGLMLAIVHPGTSAIWPAAGMALAAVLLWGVRISPAILLGSFLANATTLDTVAPALPIAIGNTLEALAAGYLLARYSGGARTFDTPSGIATFGLVTVLVSTPISATIGTGALWLSGTPAPLSSLWLTWWLGNLTGVLVVAPALVLWFRQPPAAREFRTLVQIIAFTIVVGVIAFSPALSEWINRGLIGFLALVPLLLTALSRGQRDTATVSLLLSAIAVWGTIGSAEQSPDLELNNALLMTLIFLVSTSLPSLALSAEISTRNHADEQVRRAHEDLEETVQTRTAALVRSNAELRRMIEQKKELEAASEHQRSQLLEAQRLANLGSWTWNVKTDVVTWSPQLYEIYGLTPETFAGTRDDFLARIHPEDREEVIKIITAAYQSGSGFRSRERIVRPDGEIRHLESHGKIVKDSKGNVVELLGICQDITARKAADTALRESEEQLRRLVNGIHDYAIFMLDPSGRIVSWNAGAARIKRYSREQALGNHVSVFYTPEDQAADVASHALKTAAVEGRYEGEGWRVRRDGSRFWANVVIDAIYDTDGKLVGFGKITRDVTEKREAMLALDQTRDQLAQAQKMEAIGQITGGVAHDFNNLLAAAISSLHLLEKRLPSEPQSKRLLENALSAAERGTSLTQRLLSFARRQDLKPEIVDIPKLVGNMADLLSRSIGPSIAIKTTSSGSRTTARVDPTQFELAIFNLAINARDAMPNGGSLAIDISDDIVADAIAGSDLKPGSYVLITVRDTGAGMDENTLRRAVEPFFTTKGIGKGTGLGLSTVQGLAVQSGGAMKIESKVGQGTAISVWLPASDNAATPAVLKSAQTAAPIKACHVLVVDDDPLVAMGTVAMLEDLGHSVVEVSSGKQALKVLETDAKIDLVITDQAMPGMTGTELVKIIREQQPKLPIILATGWAELPDNPVPEFLRLSKPYRQEDLAIAIGRVLNRA
jgi:PAS domain S-box-containing protein